MLFRSMKESIIFPGKKILVVSHCILNQNAVVNGWERARGAYPIAKYILEKGVGMIQLPCPELLCMGLERAAMSYEDYNSIEGYRKRCLDLLEPVIIQLKMYKESNYKYLGVIGAAGQPAGRTGPGGLPAPQRAGSGPRGCLAGRSRQPGPGRHS